MRSSQPSQIPPAPGRVKAATVRVRDQFVRARYGATSHERYRAAASKELLETVTTAADRWVPFAHFIEASELACRLFNHGDVTLSREIGRFGAEANMGVWRSLVYRLLSPQMVLNIASGLWSHHYEGGRLVARARGEHGIVLRIEDFPTPHRTHCLAIEGWLQRTLELGRPKRVLVHEAHCRLSGSDACEIVAEWE